MKSFIVAALLLFSVSSFASSKSVKGILGFSSGAVNFGAEYEQPLNNKRNSPGVGGYFLYSGGEKDVSAPKITTFGGVMTFHMTVARTWDFYVAPGFGIALYELESGGSTTKETLLGPSMRYGVMHPVSPKADMGVEVFKGYNWLSKKVTGGIEYMNVVARFKF